MSSSFGGLPLAATVLPVVGQFQTANTTTYPPSSLDPAVFAATQVLPEDITITGFQGLYTNTVTAFPLSFPFITYQLYSGPPGIPASPVPAVSCSIPMAPPIANGATGSCTQSPNVNLSAGSTVYMVAYTDVSDSITLSGQASFGLTTD